MWTVRNIAAVIWIESRDTAFCIRKPYVDIFVSVSTILDFQFNF